MEQVATGDPGSRLIRSRPVTCRVIGLTEAAANIRIVRLEVVSGGPFRFAAGQYGLVTFGDQRPREYSMANAPDDDVLEFHVRHLGTGGASAYVARQLRVGDRVRLEGPFGHAWLRGDHHGPILAIAGGSGMAPIKSIVDTLVRHRVGHDVRVYVGVRKEAELYLDAHFRGLAAVHPSVQFIAAVAEPTPSTQQRIGTVLDVVAADIERCDRMKAYVAGPPAMVDAAAQLLLARGLRPEDFHSDLFDPSALATPPVERAAGGEAG